MPKHRLRIQLAIPMLAMMSLAHAAQDRDDPMQLARYTQLAQQPSQTELDPLAVIAQLRIPRSVATSVGDAITHILARTGYRVNASDELATRLFSLPLPESHRQLGPHRVVTMVQILTGDAFTLCIDRFERVINIQATSTGQQCPLIRVSEAIAETPVQEPAQ